MGCSLLKSLWEGLKFLIIFIFRGICRLRSMNSPKWSFMISRVVLSKGRCCLNRISIHMLTSLCNLRKWRRMIRRLGLIRSVLLRISILIYCKRGLLLVKKMLLKFSCSYKKIRTSLWVMALWIIVCWLLLWIRARWIK